MISIRTLTANDWAGVARLIHESTNTWYTRRGMSQCFPGGSDSTRVFCEVYEQLDPGCCFLATDSATGEIVGSCFWHPRPTHLGLGIMNVHPDHFGRGLASKLLRSITSIADEKRLPVRLVSSAMNLDSFSLYNRAGFVPQTVFQDMLISVGDGVAGSSDEHAGRIRAATASDLPAIVELEYELSGIRREQDWRLFVENHAGYWRTLVYERQEGAPEGVLAAIRHPGSNMIGPGVARNESQMCALTRRMLPFHRNNTAVMLVPVLATGLAQTLYQCGAKNCELHFSQVRGQMNPPTGIVIPSFMPESG